MASETMLFSSISLADVHQDLIRNIVSIRVSQDLFDDLSDNPANWAMAQHVEDEVKPHPYQSRSPIIDRPFEDAHWFNAIDWPFKNWQQSRFSNGTFGVWYGCDCAETSVYETAYHWVTGLLGDAGFDREPVVGERKLYAVACDAALVDLRPVLHQYPELSHKSDYSHAQQIGSRLHREGHPGLITKSVRRSEGDNYVVLNPAVLTNPRMQCHLTYRLDGDRIVVEKQPGICWFDMSISGF